MVPNNIGGGFNGNYIGGYFWLSIKRVPTAKY